MIGNYLQQTTSADDIFTCIFFLGALRVKPSSKYFFTDGSKAVILLWIIHFISVLCLLCFHVCLFIDALWSPTEKGLNSLLSFVMSNCEFVTFPLVSWIRCGT